MTWDTEEDLQTSRCMWLDLFVGIEFPAAVHTSVTVCYHEEEKVGHLLLCSSNKSELHL